MWRKQTLVKSAVVNDSSSVIELVNVTNIFTIEWEGVKKELNHFYVNEGPWTNRVLYYQDDVLLFWKNEK